MTATQERVRPESAAGGRRARRARATPRAQKVWIVGGNTLEGMGFPPERVDVTLDTTR